MLTPYSFAGEWFSAWFIIKNGNGVRNDHLMCQPPTVLLENGSMVHDQTNVDRNGSYQRPFYGMFPNVFTVKTTNTNGA